MKTTTRNIVTTKVCPALATMALFLFVIQPASAATDTWVGNTSANWGDTPNNWSGGNNPPANGDSLVFGAQGSSGTSLANTLTSLAAYGITFSGPDAFTFSGNSLLLSGQSSYNFNFIGIANNSAAAQTIGLPLSLDWGYYTFSTSGGGSLALDGGLTLVTGTGYSSGSPGGVAYFDANNTTAASPTALTLDGTTGLISGLEGAALMYSGSGAAPTGLATIPNGGGAISAYAGYTSPTAGGGVLASPGNNLLLTDSLTPSPTYTANNLSVNTISAAQVGNSAGNATTIIQVNGTTSFGNNGGLYVLDSAAGSKT